MTLTRRRSKVGVKRAAAKPQPTERGRGRPPLGDAARSERLQIFVTPAVLARAVAAAALEGRKVADWGARVIERALTTPTDPPTT